MSKYIFFCMEACQSRKLQSSLPLSPRDLQRISDFLLYLFGYEQRSKKSGLRQAAALQTLALLRSFVVTVCLTLKKKEFLKNHHYLTMMAKISRTTWQCGCNQYFCQMTIVVARERDAFIPFLAFPEKRAKRKRRLLWKAHSLSLNIDIALCLLFFGRA